jgi:hypothetical protein
MYRFIMQGQSFNSSLNYRTILIIMVTIISVTLVENLTASSLRLLCKISYYLLPMFSPIFLSSSTCYRIVCRGLRLTPSPTNSTHI